MDLGMSEDEIGRASSLLAKLHAVAAAEAAAAEAAAAEAAAAEAPLGPRHSSSSNRSEGTEMAPLPGRRRNFRSAAAARGAARYDPELRTPPSELQPRPTSPRRGGYFAARRRTTDDRVEAL